jgi:hypothetical protein
MLHHYAVLVLGTVLWSLRKKTEQPNLLQYCQFYEFWTTYLNGPSVVASWQGVRWLILKSSDVQSWCHFCISMFCCGIIDSCSHLTLGLVVIFCIAMLCHQIKYIDTISIQVKYLRCLLKQKGFQLITILHFSSVGALCLSSLLSTWECPYLTRGWNLWITTSILMKSCMGLLV